MSGPAFALPAAVLPVLSAAGYAGVRRGRPEPPPSPSPSSGRPAAPRLLVPFFTCCRWAGCAFLPASARLVRSSTGSSPALAARALEAPAGLEAKRLEHPSTGEV